MAASNRGRCARNSVTCSSRCSCTARSRWRPRTASTSVMSPTMSGPRDPPHPHVFGDVAVDGAAGVVVNWEKLKTAEKRERLRSLTACRRRARSRMRRASRTSCARGLRCDTDCPIALDGVRDALARSRSAGGLAEAETRRGLGCRSRRSGGRDRQPALCGGRARASPAGEPEEALRTRTMFARRFRAPRPVRARTGSTSTTWTIGMAVLLGGDRGCTRSRGPPVQRPGRRLGAAGV